MNKHVVVASTLQILNDHELEAVSGGDDENTEIGDTEPRANEYGNDMAVPDEDAGGGMSWRYIGST